MKRIVGVAAAVGVLALAGCAQIEAHRYVTRMKNRPAPDFELTALDGGTVKLSDHRGSPVLLAFWAYG